MSWRATVPCSRAQGESIAHGEDLFPGSENPPVLVADEPNPGSPESWLIHAYFNERPTSMEIATITSLGNGPPQIEQLGEEDWVRISQAGLEPIRAGRFFVHTPTFPPEPGKTNFEIDAGLAFGTGQHATTASCLEALDQLQRSGLEFTNVADIGTGTGLLAFAALALWPGAKCIGTDIDSTAIDVAGDNAAINRVKRGHGPGELLLAEADGMGSPLLSARAPFDLIIANILAQPLIELAKDFSNAIADQGTLVLAGILDTQAAAVASGYQKHGLRLARQSSGEWPVLVLRAQKN